MPENFDWIHRYEPGTSDLTLLLLHGTGGNETSLLQFGREVAPTANLLSVRGRSLEEGSPRFFRRFTEIRYDQDHIKSEAASLASFVEQASDHYGFDAAKVVALGYSNGANIALALLLLHPGVLSGAVLWRPVMPLENPEPVSLEGKSLLLTLGVQDPYRKHADGLLAYLKNTHSDTQIEEFNTGHQLARNDLMVTRDWLARHF